MTKIVDSLSEISSDYDVALVDLWGCVHDGINPHESAMNALKEYRKGGGTVIVLTNSPRSRKGVKGQLDMLGITDECYDAIASSGDAARVDMFKGVVGTNVWFIGQEQDMHFFDPVDDKSVEINHVPLDEAEGIVCISPFNPIVDPFHHMMEDFKTAIDRKLKMLCGNPDLVVDRGNTREWCAGSLARIYEKMGGTVLHYGKPYRPIYDVARKRMKSLEVNASSRQILAIGDGPYTDVPGAMNENIDCLFVTGGLMKNETETDYDPNPEALNRCLENENIDPKYSIGMLR